MASALNLILAHCLIPSLRLEVLELFSLCFYSATGTVLRLQHNCESKANQKQDDNDERDDSVTKMLLGDRFILETVTQRFSCNAMVTIVQLH